MWKGLSNLFGQRQSSRDVAKGRLHLVLAHDRVGLEGGRLQAMRQEIAAVIAKYVPIDTDGVEIQIETHARRGTDAQLTVSTAVPARTV